MAKRSSPLQQIIAKDTHLYAPDGIHRVVLQFASENEAIIFHEFLIAWSTGKLDVFVEETE